MTMPRTWLWMLLLCFVAHANQSVADDNPRRTPRMLVGTLSLPSEEFQKFVERIRPDFVVMGAFGAPQWAAQESPQEWVEQWRTVFERMHRSGVKVVGMVELLNAGNDLIQVERFVDFYDNRWDERLLGKKPPVSALSLLEKRSMAEDQQSGAHAPRGCAVNPNWRSVEKALVKAMIDAGIDGFITHRNMFGECGCPFCHADWDQAQRAKQSAHKHRSKRTPKATEPIVEVACDHCRGGLRRWLADRNDQASLKQIFGIADLKTHRFEPIYGHHRDHERLPSPLQLEAMKFARHAVKEAFDDVFVQFARKVKPELLVAQWNHMPYFDELHLDGGHIPRFNMTTFAHASADERWSLPIELWGRGEGFYWYCNWGTCQNTQLDKQFLADVTLYAKLLRNMARGKPYVINKYDFYRPRNMMAEAAALGMIAGAIQVPYRTQEDQEVMERYFKFLRRHADLYASNNGESVADALLIYPRTVTHTGDAAALEMIEVAGRTMIVEHIQFDFASDDLLPSVDLDRYKVVIAAETSGLNHERLAAYVKQGGKLIAVPRTAAKAADPNWREMRAIVVAGLEPHTAGKPAAKPFRKALLDALGDRQATFEAPYTVEPHVYRQPGNYVVHLVNYNHTEKAPGKSNVAREAPIAASPVRMRLPLPAGVGIKGVSFLDPDVQGARRVEYTRKKDILTLRTPAFLVYGVCVIETK